MNNYSIARAKAMLSRLLKEVAGGQEVTITDHNKPVAKLVAVNGLPALPRVDVSRILRRSPISLGPGAVSSTDLVRTIRDEE